MRTSLGDLRGTSEGGVGVWRGVPYAEQPVGDRRFQAPAPLQPWTGVRDALEHGPLPPQGKSFVGGGRDDPKVRDEACLTLTVWSPDTSASLPVMVWIPGGAFVFGAGQFQLYNGSRLAANGNVVVVNVTYRIGVFGGFELGDLGDGFDDNLALRDQMAALRWIRDNIAAFGGDADRVTVFGESAGATSVLALLASPAADGLFSRAIAQSPALPLIADREVRAKRAHEFLQRLGVGPAEVKGLPQRQLRRAAGRLQFKSAATTPTLAYGLTYGVDLLPRHPVDAAREGTLARVPLIIGTNSHEASMFAWTKPPMLPTTQASIDAYFKRVAPDAKDEVLAAYPDYPRRRALIAFGSDVMFGGPAWAFADAYSAHRAYPHVPLRPLRLEPADARAGRHPRQRDRAHPTQLRVVRRAQTAPARAAAAAAGRPAHATGVAGLRRARAGRPVGSSGPVDTIGRSTKPSIASPGSSSPPATRWSRIPTPSAARPGRGCTEPWRLGA